MAYLPVIFIPRIIQVQTVYVLLNAWPLIDSGGILAVGVDVASRVRGTAEACCADDMSLRSRSRIKSRGGLALACNLVSCSHKDQVCLAAPHGLAN